MPKRYWRNLPEAALIPELLAQAPDAHARRCWRRRPRAVAQADPGRSRRGGAARCTPARSRELRAAGGRLRRAARCTGHATQTVFGEGPADAPDHAGRRAAGRPGGPRRAALRRPGRPAARPGAGGGRHRAPAGLRHQRGQALQVRAARQAAHPQDARPATRSSLPLVARPRARAGPAAPHRGARRHRRARRSPAAPSRCCASAAG